MDRRPVKEIIKNIEKFIYDDTILVTQIAYRIVEETMGRDDYDELVDDFKELEHLAEIGADTEILDDDADYINEYLERMRSTFDYIKEIYGGSDDAVVGRRVYIFRFLKHEKGRGDYYLANSTLNLDDLGDLELVFGASKAKRLTRLAGNMLDEDLSESSKAESSKLLKKMLKDLETAHDKILDSQAKEKPAKRD